MDALETLIRETLLDHAADAPADDGLLDAVTAHRRRWWPAGLAAAAVVLLAVGIAAVAARGGHDTIRTGDSPSRPAPVGQMKPAFIPPTKVIAYRGITLRVPDDLPEFTTPCLLPPSRVEAVDPNVQYDCVAGGVDPTAKDTTVKLESINPEQTRLATPPGVTYGPVAGLPGAGGVRVLEQGITITVSAPTHDDVVNILESVAIGPTPGGCPDDFSDLPGAVLPLRPLLPEGATSATRCIYASQGWLLATMSLDNAATIASRIDELPTGSQPADPNGYERDLLRFAYDDGSVHTISVVYDDPSTFSDGGRTVHDVGNRVVELIRSSS